MIYSVLIWRHPKGRDFDTYWICETPNQTFVSKNLHLFNAYNMTTFGFDGSNRYFHLAFRNGRNNDLPDNENNFIGFELFGETESEALDYMINNLDFMANSARKEFKKAKGNITPKTSRHLIHQNMIYNPYTNTVGGLFDSVKKRIIFPGPLKHYEEKCTQELTKHYYRYLTMDEFINFTDVLDMKEDIFLKYRKQFVQVYGKYCEEIKGIYDYLGFIRVLCQRVNPTNVYLTVKSFFNTEILEHEV